MRALSRICAPLVGAWLRWVRGYRIDSEQRRRLTSELRSAPGTLVCANHVSARDGWLLRWILGGDLWIVADSRSRFARPWSRILFALDRTIAVSQRHGLHANRRAFARVAERLALGESVLIFPEGTENATGTVDVEQYSYLVGKLRRDLPRLRVLCLHLKPETTLRLTWKFLPRGQASTGLRAIRDLARPINFTLKELELAHR